MSARPPARRPFARRSIWLLSLSALRSLAASRPKRRAECNNRLSRNMPARSSDRVRLPDEKIRQPFLIPARYADSKNIALSNKRRTLRYRQLNVLLIARFRQRLILALTPARFVP